MMWVKQKTRFMATFNGTIHGITEENTHACKGRISAAAAAEATAAKIVAEAAYALTTC
jgi:hypothetical protein